ncbi:hypothetical protein COL940_008673 [Colletotrichum noveboracense]|nr:hypothetical protein COL940_008673 [Colletotrichum noveboracense]
MGSREQPAALLEGRRIYLGNLLYVVRPVEIEDTLKDNDFGNFEKIVISVDPVNGRNPGYCFVDFVERADAERALSSLPYEAMGHFDKVVGTDGDGRRLYIGGLTRMIDQQQAQEEMRDILAGFNPIREPSRLQKEDSSWRGRHARQNDAPRDEQSGTGWTRNPAPRESKDDWPTMSSQSSANSSQPSWPVSKGERRSEDDRSSWKKMGWGTPNSSSSKTDQPLRSLASSNWRQKS